MLEVLTKVEKLLVQLLDLIQKHPDAVSKGYHRVFVGALNGVRKKIEWLKIANKE